MNQGCTLGQGQGGSYTNLEVANKKDVMDIGNYLSLISDALYAVQTNLDGIAQRLEPTPAREAKSTVYSVDNAGIIAFAEELLSRTRAASGLSQRIRERI